MLASPQALDRESARTWPVNVLTKPLVSVEDQPLPLEEELELEVERPEFWSLLSSLRRKEVEEEAGEEARLEVAVVSSSAVIRALSAARASRHRKDIIKRGDATAAIFMCLVMFVVEGIIWRW